MSIVDRAVRRANTTFYRFARGTLIPRIRRIGSPGALLVQMRPFLRRRYSERVREINSIAFQHLDKPVAGLNVNALLAELDVVQAGDLPLAQEARVLLNLAGRKSAKKMRGALMRLQKERHAAGEAEKFDSFFKHLQARFPPDMLYGHHFGSKTFSQREHSEVWARVEEILEELTAFSDQVFLNSGTLLGVVRDKKLLDHDDDIDLAVVLKATTQEEAAKEWQALRLRLIDAGLAIPRVGAELAEPGMIKVFSKAADGYGIDLFPAWVNDGAVYVFPYSLGDLKEEDVFPLQDCQVTGLPIPARPNRVLEANYGKGWREPDPFYVFPWRLSHIRFRRYIQTLQAIRPKRVITYGTFDLFHHGHVRLLRRLSFMADEVIVGCSTDEFNAQKGKKTAVPYAQRVEMLRACKYVTQVIPERKWEQKRGDIKRLKADMFVIGDDWRGEFDDLSDICEVLYLPRTRDISTTMLKDDIRNGAGKNPGAQKGVDGKARSPA